MSIVLGLDRIKGLLSLLSNPQDNFTKIIHVAGTNGKGSTCHYISTYLSKHCVVGTFYSPFWVKPHDSIHIQNKPIDQDTYSVQRSKVNGLNSVDASDFECLFATALLLLVECDVLVVEVGLGGLLDATNVFHDKISVITRIDYDHCEFLGDTLGQIAFQKLGIVEDNKSVVVGVQSDKGRECISRIAEQRGLVVNWVTCMINDNKLIAIDRYGKEEARVSVDIPVYQWENIAVAWAAIREILWFSYETDLQSFVDVASSRRLPGRCTWGHINLNGNKVKILLDGAHNVDGWKELAKYLSKQHPIHWCFGLKKGKAAVEMMNILVSEGDACSALVFDSPPGMPWIQSLTDWPQGINVFSCFDDYLSFLGDGDGPLIIVVTGSLYLVHAVINHPRITF